MLDAGRVLKDLDALWRTTGKQESGGVLRACAMTMLVAGGDCGEAAETLADLMREHPSRLVLIAERPGAGEPSARANVQCWMPFGRRQQICSEQIEMEAEQLGELLPAVRGVLVPDLPVVLWCRDLALAGRAEFHELAALAGKVIVDTAGLGDAAEAWAVLAKFDAGRAVVADLAWTRLTRWRETVQQAFRSEGCREKLSAVQRVELRWAGAGMPSTVAYLAGWLRWLAPSAELELACIDPRMPAKGFGRIRELRLGGPGLDVRLRRPEGIGVAIEIEGLAARVMFPRLDQAALLREELSVFGRDEHFERALERGRAA
jgi:hypothetical protein